MFWGPGNETPRILQVGANGAICATGYIQSTDAAFPNVSGTLASAGGDDGFISVSTPITSAPPIADASPGRDEDQAFAFDASLSSDPDGDLLTYRWHFGDGETAETMSPTITDE